MIAYVKSLGSMGDGPIIFVSPGTLIERFNIYGVVGVLACVVFVRVFLGFTLFIYDWLFCEEESVGPSLVECFLCC